MPLKASIVVDCERMKYPFTGLYHYCLHLATALQEEGTDIDLHFYAQRELASLFGKGSLLEQRSMHRFFMPSLENFQLWHCTHQASAYFPFRQKIPVLLTVHDLNYLYDENRSSFKKKRFLDDLQRKMDRAAHVVTISQFVLDELRQHLEVNVPASVIYNGCTVDLQTTITAPTVKPQKPFLFSLGTIARKKNFHVLPQLLLDNEMQLVIGGIAQDEAYKEEVVQAAKEIGVSERLVFTGAIPEAVKQWYYQHCEAFVFPSIAEGFGLPVVEALHFGKPVILSRFTSLPEIGGDAAYYFDSFEPESMRQTLRSALDDFNTNNKSEAARKRASLFSWKESARQYLDLYRKLAQ